ncbi:hypothetical protein RhiirC2_769988 [Rhizophagus irregularis]|uniref:Uncharacterized protein n=1 Tax=Rhizophagus irregularis TaxID=588596 RepID=A0A2N1NXU0_9GLOM|nr:hypothetical protein RhiirC2_769988 [Rhizophagus irregularis]
MDFLLTTVIFSAIDNSAKALNITEVFDSSEITRCLLFNINTISYKISTRLSLRFLINNNVDVNANFRDSSDTSETNTYDSTGIFIFEVCIFITTNTSALDTFSANFNVDNLADAFIDGASTDIFSSTATIGVYKDEFNLVLSLATTTDDNAFNSALLLAIGNACRIEFNSAFLLAISSICKSEFNLLLLLVNYGACRGEFNSVLLW